MNLVSAFGRAASDRRHGASEIERALIASLLESRPSWRPEVLHRGADEIVSGQPAMANVRRLAALLRGRDWVVTERELRRRLEVLERLDDLLGGHGAALLEGCGRVVTISRSSAVAAILGGAVAAGWAGEAVVLDGTPSGRGVDQARSLRASGVAASSQPDGALWGALGSTLDRTLVVVGADAVGDRFFVNACGSRALCELAAVRSVPVVLVADSGKDVGEDGLGAVLAAARVHREPGPGRHWPVFEMVPLALVRERLDEEKRTVLACRALC